MIHACVCTHIHLLYAFLLLRLCRVAVSVRDLLTWVTFMNKTSGYLSPPQGFYHGAHLVFVDALGCGSSLGAADLKKDALDYLLSILQQWSCVLSEVDCTKVVTSDDKLFGVSPFYIEIGKHMQ